MQHSKSCVTILFCGNAVGTFLSPMVVYKSQNLYAEWTRGGPPGTVYDNTQSGWFDSRCFERWFTDIFLVQTRSDGEGKRVLLGDNLASHFTPQVIESSIENNIVFICLVPNLTHLLQPLDVAVFRPVNVVWRQTLETWRKESRIEGAIPKIQFPALLAKLQSRLKGENLIAGL